MEVKNLSKAVLYQKVIDLVQDKRRNFVQELNNTINDDAYNEEVKKAFIVFRNKVVDAENLILEQIYDKIKEL